MSYFLEQFGKKIKGFRTLRGLSQERLAELVDVSTKTVGLWETGKSFIEFPKLQKLAEVLEVEIEEFFNFPTKTGNSVYEQICFLTGKLSPVKQKQILDIIKTF